VRIGLRLSLGGFALAGLVAAVGLLTAVTNTAVQREVKLLHQSSLQELVGATDMLLAIKTTHATVQELLAETWRQRAAGQKVDPVEIARARQAIETGLEACAERLTASRTATLRAIDLASGTTSPQRVEAEHRELTAWLDRLGPELDVHRGLLRELVEIVGDDPGTAGRFLDERVEPHYLDSMFPLIVGYQQDAVEEFETVTGDVSRLLSAATRRSSAVALLAVIAALGLGILLTQSIATPPCASATGT
jgi:hypothetical protein